MIKKFEKWREVMVLNFFKFSIEKYGKWFLKCVGTVVELTFTYYV